jgi:hypothetical protein
MNVHIYPRNNNAMKKGKRKWKRKQTSDCIINVIGAPDHYRLGEVIPLFQPSQLKYGLRFVRPKRRRSLTTDKLTKLRDKLTN